MNRDRVEEILNRPYRRVLVPDALSGGVTATIPEFPGCIAEGASTADALENLERVARSWVESLLSRGLDVPSPMESRDYSGRFPLRLPRSLHERAAQIATEDGVSLNTFLIMTIAERLGLRQATAKTEGLLHEAVQQLKILEVGLQKFDRPSNLTVDPALVQEGVAAGKQ